MSRERVEFLELPSLLLTPNSLAPGEVESRSVQLSAERGSGAETRLVWFAAYWYWQPSAPSTNDLEILVLDGALTIDDWEIKRGGYLYLPASNTGAQDDLTAGMLSTLDDRFRGEFRKKNPPKCIADISAIPWVPVPDFRGRAASEAGPKVFYKMLHEDQVTTAYTLLSYKVGGWFDPRLEAHETWEELVLMEGDYLMGMAGQVLPGTYIFRAGDEPHGPQATRTSAVWFARGNKQIDFDFSESEVGERQVELYLANSSWPENTDLQPWGNWS